MVKKKNYTFSLPIDQMEKLKNYVNEEELPSLNSAVREAIATYIASHEKQKLKDEMKKAAQDPLFLEDIRETMADFSHSDSEVDEED